MERHLFHWLKSVHIQSYSGPHFPALRSDYQKYSTTWYQVGLVKASVEHYYNQSFVIAFVCKTILNSPIPIQINSLISVSLSNIAVKDQEHTDMS